MVTLKIIFASLLGSFLSYILVNFFSGRDKNVVEEHKLNNIEYRLNRWNSLMKMDIRLLVWDFIIAVIIVGLAYTLFVLEVTSPKQAFWGGLTAESSMVYIVNNLRYNNK